MLTLTQIQRAKGQAKGATHDATQDNDSEGQGAGTSGQTEGQGQSAGPSGDTEGQDQVQIVAPAPKKRKLMPLWPTGPLDVTVTFDGTWSKQGYTGFL